MERPFALDLFINLLADMRIPQHIISDSVRSPANASYFSDLKDRGPEPPPDPEYQIEIDKLNYYLEKVAEEKVSSMADAKKKFQALSALESGKLYLEYAEKHGGAIGFAIGNADGDINRVKQMYPDIPSYPGPNSTDSGKKTQSRQKMNVSPQRMKTLI